jgi:hypothetical protein
VKHSIETSGRPVSAKPQRLDAAKRAVAENKFRIPTHCQTFKIFRTSYMVL